jgi:biopolymer transport protein ExbD
VVTVDAQGSIYWYDARVPTPQVLADQLTRIAAQKPQPELHIRADARADYESIGRVVYAAQQAGIARIGFLTEPPQGGAR